MFTDPSKLAGLVKISPAMIDGEFTGFRVREGKNRKVFRALGLKANDITEVKGIVLQPNKSTGLQMLEAIESATELSLKVKRGSQELIINHSFESKSH